jgi:hypothetical protein
MPILDKHGKIYTLRGPNPLLEHQDRWDVSQTVLINFTAEEVVIHDTYVLHWPKEPERTSVLAEFAEEIKAAEVEEEILEVIPDDEEEDQEISAILDRHSVSILCMPVLKETKHENDYGDVHISYEYGEETTFRGIIVEETGLYLKVWSDRKFNPKSILYPQGLGNRFWKIEYDEEKSGGYVMTCISSTVHPVFKGSQPH